MTVSHEARNEMIVEMATMGVAIDEIAGHVGCSRNVVVGVLYRWRRASYRRALIQRRVPQDYIAAVREMARLA